MVGHGLYRRLVLMLRRGIISIAWLNAALGVAMKTEDGDGGI
jgi:hypothetical protein